MKLTSLYGGYVIYKEVVIEPYGVNIDIDLTTLGPREIRDMYTLYLAKKILVEPVEELEEAYNSSLTNGIKYSTEEEVNNKFSALINSAPELFDTLKEIADWIQLEGVDAANLATSLSSKANISHLHTITDVSGLQTSLDNKLNSSSGAISAAKLTTARTINGVPFNGESNITITDSTKLNTTGGTISGNLTVTGITTLNTALPVTSGGTGVNNISDLKIAIGVPQIIQITQANYDLLSTAEKTNNLKLYLIIG